MYYVGADLGGTKIAVGIVDEDGQLIYKDSIPAKKERPSEEIINDLARLCVKVLEVNKIPLSDVVSIGIGSPGSCDFENGIVIYSNNLKFNNVPIRDLVKKVIDLPVYVDNDANCAAYGESVAGACADYRDSITITLGTGVGSGIIIDGKIVRGCDGSAGELGHHAIRAGGELCSCGRRGCWEAYASATALIRDAQIAAARNPESLLYKTVDGELGLITGKIVFDAADCNDKTAKEVVSSYIEYIAEGLANVVSIFSPDIIAIGGGISAQGERILAPVREKVKSLVYGNILNTKIVAAELGNDAGIIGAAFLGRKG
jgi:glucokinase